MRRAAIFVLFFAIILVGYVTSMAISTSRFIDAVRAGRAEEILSRTDLNRLKQSLTDQIIGAYLDRVGRSGKPVASFIANTYGSSVADAMLSKLLTAENLKDLLQRGTARSGNETLSLPPLASVDAHSLMDFIQRIFPVSVAEVGLRLSKERSGDEFAAASFRFGGAGWKLATVTLPKSRVRELAASLPVR